MKQWLFVVLVPQFRLLGRTTPFMTAGVRAGARVSPRTAPAWPTTPNGSRDSTPGSSPRLTPAQSTSHSCLSLLCILFCILFQPDADAQNFAVNLQDGSWHGGVESLRAIQRKGEAGLLPSNKEEKEKIPNGNLHVFFLSLLFCFSNSVNFIYVLPYWTHL